MVPRHSAARRKHPHFTDSELDLVYTVIYSAMCCGATDPDFERVYFKCKAAQLARGTFKRWNLEKDVIPKQSHG